MEIEEGKKLIIRRDKVPLEALSRALWDDSLAMRHRGKHVTLEIHPCETKMQCLPRFTPRSTLHRSSLAHQVRIRRAILRVPSFKESLVKDIHRLIDPRRCLPSSSRIHLELVLAPKQILRRHKPCAGHV